MQIDLYKKHYYDFDAEFFPDATIDDVEEKMTEEMSELAVEIYDGTLADKISECLDVMNMSIKLLGKYGVKNPLFAGWQKLQVTAEKYRALRESENVK